jgi:hypothetical protein
MHATCAAKRSQQEHSFLPKPNVPLWHNINLVATTFNNSKFQDNKVAMMDNDSMFVKTKTNNNDYIPSASIEYYLYLIHVQLLHLLHFELFIIYEGKWLS